MKWIIITLLAFCATFAISEGAVFDFNGTLSGSLGEALDGEQGPIPYTNGGIEATFSTAVGNIMNAASSDFGIDSGTSTEDDLDAFNLGEWLDITFDSLVTLTDITVSSFGSGNQGVIYVNGVSNGVINASGSTTFDIDVAVGQTLRIEGTGQTNETNGWSLDSMTVVPEPATMAMFGIGGLVAFLVRRSSRR